MATFDNQQGWLQVENSRDCTQGFCTIYCPQWCYVLFPPPPPFSIPRNFNTSTTAFSPLVIAIIGILATFFLVVSYYTLVTKFCCSISFHRNHSHHRSNLGGNLEEEDSIGESYHEVSWHLPPSNGLDEELIRKFTVCRYKRGEGLVDSTEYSVCLAEFTEDESLRLLPKCSWSRAATAADNEQEDFVVVEVLDLERIGDEENEVENEVNMSKDSEVIEIGDEGSGLLRRSLLLELVLRGRVEMCVVAKDQRLVSAMSSRLGRGKRGKARSYRIRGLHSVISAVRMKRSVSSGRTMFARQGRGKVLLLPVWGKEAQICWV